MALIKKLKDKQNNTIYPKTSFNAVENSSGNTLDVALTELNNNLAQVNSNMLTKLNTKEIATVMGSVIVPCPKYMSVLCVGTIDAQQACMLIISNNGGTSVLIRNIIGSGSLTAEIVDETKIKINIPSNTEAYVLYV